MRMQVVDKARKANISLNDFLRRNPGYTQTLNALIRKYAGNWEEIRAVAAEKYPDLAEALKTQESEG